MIIQHRSNRVVELSEWGYTDAPFIAWNNLIGDATLTTSNGTKVQSAVYTGTPSTWDRWVATPNAGNYAAVDITFASPVDVSCICLVGHNIASLGGSVRPFGSDDGGVTFNAVCPLVTPDDDNAIAFRFSTETYARWRVLISNVTDDAQIAHIFIGNEMIIPRRMYQGVTPPLTPNIVDLQANVTEGANIISVASVSRGSSVSHEFTLVPEWFVRGPDYLAFQRHWNAGGTAFVAWRPSKYNDLVYMWRGSGGAIVPVNSGPLDFMSFTLEGRAHHV